MYYVPCGFGAFLPFSFTPILTCKNRHFIARALCLIGLPIMFYMAMFEIHFAILRNPGDGDAFMSSEFQRIPDGKGMHWTYAGSYSILPATKNI